MTAPRPSCSSCTRTGRLAARMRGVVHGGRAAPTMHTVQQRDTLMCLHDIMGAASRVFPPVCGWWGMI